MESGRNQGEAWRMCERERACCFAALFLLAGTLPAQDPHLTVLVYDHAGLPERSLSKVTHQAAAVLSRAGVSSEWVNCGQEESDPRCSGGAEDGVVMIRIQPDRPKSFPNALGLAFTAGEAPNLASVFERAARSFAARNALPFEPLLARAIAHEIGHLILGPDAHSAIGVMRPRWNRNDVVKMAQGIMTFDVQQSRLLRTRLARRIASR
jgi:hypothetical protein